MISINNLNYNIGSRVLYEGANLHIKPKDKIGLIGLNGTGKSTLLKMIVGDLTIDGGDISQSKDCTIGFLNQDLLSYQSAEPILDVAMKAFAEAVDIHHKIDKVLAEMEANYSDDLVTKLTKLQERFEALDGYAIQSKAEEILEGIGFSTKDLTRPLKEFSGGWRMRVMLAKLLLEKPSLLMLDEPTNHLDLPSIQWVESYLKTYEGAVIVVSHDRHFINNTVNTIVEVSNGKLNLYAGNYDFYLQEKELRNEIQKNAFENQQQKIKQTEKFIERFKAKATKARQVQSRVKALDRMDKIDDVLDENAKVNFRFNFNKPSGRHVIQLTDVSKSYGDLVILKNTNAHIERGDKIALIGANGKGKSTLLRIIAGTDKVNGKREEGYNVIKSFYAQHQLEALNIEYEILEEMKASGTDKTEMQLRSVLGCFLFSDEDVFKKIKVLSGGEKSRVALAKTLISEANFLLLDEPTNHLDIQSVNILIQALQQYEGTFIVVSHDRYFVTEIANKIWYIENNEIKEYPGTYEEYMWWKEKQVATAPAVQPQVKKEEPKGKPKPASSQTNNLSMEAQKELKALRKKLDGIENEILETEVKIEEAEKELASPEVFESPDALAQSNEKYQLIKAELERLNDQWEETGIKIEELEKQLA
ncbi:ABC-F family ATP-binding cassette domain-containing protein [uncultured Imperialibacter sp.]|uniref:ABC-F family ATP-binding cassette domain-containing protein n=1 Tax=uncultured Imperialibacter sp. TaxID=1672639 RepID=UPI0030DD4A9C|tara:strand:+ start:110805 stop:112742 length:1938 start_codon:yes stop_codon:yes gene_type:complete